MAIELKDYEQGALETLIERFGLEISLSLSFAKDLFSLALLYQEVVSTPDTEFREGRVAMMGFINHTHALLNGGLQAIVTGNGPVWSSCFRGLAETYGMCILIAETPVSSASYLKSYSAGKLYNALKRVDPDLGHDVQRLHEIVHPGAGAVFAHRVVIDEAERVVSFNFGMATLTMKEGREAVTVLANLAFKLVGKFTELIANPVVLSAGKVIMDRKV